MKIRPYPLLTMICGHQVGECPTFVRCWRAGAYQNNHRLLIRHVLPCLCTGTCKCGFHPPTTCYFIYTHTHYRYAQRHRIKRALEANQDIKYQPRPNPESYAAVRRRKQASIRNEQAHAAAKLADPHFRLTTVYHVTVTAAAQSVRKLRLEYAAKGPFQSKSSSCLTMM